MKIQPKPLGLARTFRSYQVASKARSALFQRGYSHPEVEVPYIAFSGARLLACARNEDGDLLSFDLRFLHTDEWKLVSINTW